MNFKFDLAALATNFVGSASSTSINMFSVKDIVTLQNNVLKDSLSDAVLNTVDDHDDHDSFGIGLDAFPIPTINDFDDWLNFIYEPILSRPYVPTAIEWSAMTPRERKSSWNERFRYIARLQPINTPSRDEIRDRAFLQFVSNRTGGRNAQGGGVITGSPFVGKTTLICDIGKRYDLDMRSSFKKQTGQTLFNPKTNDRFMPVIYVSLSGDDVRTIKSLYMTFARFLGVPKYENKTAKQLEDAIAKWAKKCGTSLIIIDEIHYIDTRNRGVKNTNNAIKTLMNRIPATFIFVGINCKDTGFFFDHDQTQQKKEDSTSSQLNHRCFECELKPFQNIHNNYQEGENLIGAMDQEIVLVNHQPRDLIELAPYILARTNGHVGSIRNLILLGCYTKFT